MKKLEFCLGLCFFATWSFCFNTIHANGMNPQENINKSNWSFVENKGQLLDSSGKILCDIKFYGHQSGIYVYCRSNSVSIYITKDVKQAGVSEATNFAAFNKKSDKNSIQRQFKIGRMDMIFKGSDAKVKIVPTELQTYYENFYLAGCPDAGITHVPTYKTIIYKNIYPNIDLFLHVKDQGMKYEFVVNPGGKVDDIKIQWDGFQSINALKSGGIVYKQAFGVISENETFTYQLWQFNGCSIQEVIKSKFKIQKNIISFKVKKYNSKLPLIIDPNLTWATYLGGKDNDQSNALTINNFDDIYVTGFTKSTAGIATTAAFQTAYGGGQNWGDVFIAKYDKNGVLKWSTYLGGNNDDIAQGIASDTFDHVYVVGQTSSVDGIASNGAFQTSDAGNIDAFIAKFKDDGSRIWSTYFGGLDNDGLDGIVCDGAGNEYVTGYFYSNGLATSGAYQISNRGSEDAILAKFNNLGSPVWITYYGGSGKDAGYSIARDNFGNIYITGITTSSSGIATNGSHQVDYFGGTDAFVAKFSDSGALLWATYYGGDGEEDGYAIVCNNLNEVIITGYTNSNNNIATTNAYQESINGMYDAFLAKYDSKGSLLFSTYFGGPSNDYGLTVSSDGANYIIMAGFTTSKTNIASIGTFQSAIGGGSDAYVAIFNKTGTLILSSYLGGTLADQGSSLCVDASGNFYLTGLTYSNNGIATSGAFQSTNSGGGDVFLAKFDYSHVGIEKPVFQNLSYNVFPNPFKDDISLDYELPVSSKIIIALLDVSGKEIKRLINENQVSGKYHYELSVKGLNLCPGPYILNFLSGAQSKTIRIIKK